MTTEATGLEVLFGHTSFETAMEVPDYPYGFRKRTEIRYWMEVATKGAKDGQTRLMSCTKNPDTGRWNKPKGSTYCDWGWMVRDPRTGYVNWVGLSALDMVKGIAKVTAAGVWGQLDTAERDTLTEYAARTRRRLGDYYREWDDAVARVRAAKAVHGVRPDLYTVAGLDQGPGRVYASDFKLALELVQMQDDGVATLPPLATAA